jgi:hypothetical protein
MNEGTPNVAGKMAGGMVEKSHHKAKLKSFESVQNTILATSSIAEHNPASSVQTPVQTRASTDRRPKAVLL